MLAPLPRGVERGAEATGEQPPRPGGAPSPSVADNQMDVLSDANLMDELANPRLVHSAASGDPVIHERRDQVAQRYEISIRGHLG
jgi:hypothetical protein